MKSIATMFLGVDISIVVFSGVSISCVVFTDENISMNVRFLLPVFASDILVVIDYSSAIYINYKNCADNSILLMASFMHNRPIDVTD